MDWLKKYRLSEFIKSGLYAEYNLSKTLSSAQVIMCTHWILMYIVAQSEFFNIDTEGSSCVCIREMCPYLRDVSCVCIREVCPYLRGVCIREMFVLERCLY